MSSPESDALYARELADMRAEYAEYLVTEPESALDDLTQDRKVWGQRITRDDFLPGRRI